MTTKLTWFILGGSLALGLCTATVHAQSTSNANSAPRADGTITGRVTSKGKGLSNVQVKAWPQVVPQIPRTGGLDAITDYDGNLVPARASIAQPHFQTDATIRTIRQRYERINKAQKKYRKVRRELAGFSAEGGQLVAYFDGKAIAKIVATYFGESGKAEEEFYYSNGKLIFVFRWDSRYDRPLSGKVMVTKESRFYFNDDHLVKWIDEEGKDVAPTANEFSDQEKEYLSSSTTFTTAARSKVKVIEAP
jgi:hypothetical protein